MTDLLPFLRLYRQHWLSLSIGLLLALVTLAAGMGLLSLSGWFLSAAAVAGLTAATRDHFNYMTPAGGVRFFSIIRTAGRWGERVVSHDATFRVLTRLRVWFWQKLSPLSTGALAGFRQADLLNRLVADIDAMDHVYLRLVTPIGAALLSTAGLVLFLSFFDSELALTLGAILLFGMIALPLVFYFLGRKPGQALIAEKSSLRTRLVDYLDGQAELQMFAAAPRARDELQQAEQALIQAQARMARVSGLANGSVQLLSGWTLTLMLWLAGHGVAGAAPDPITALMVFATLASFEALMPLAGAFQHLSTSLTSARRLNEILQEAKAPEWGNEERHAQQGALQISDLYFSYPGNPQPVLRGCTLQLQAGEKLALLGQTGCGKSTLMGLLTREWHPQAGKILLDGKPLTDYSEGALRASLSVVSQRVHLFADTLRGNLKLAAPHASDEQLVQVLTQVGLANLLEDDNGHSDSGLDAWLGDGGRPLSGGERRRIGIARALLHDAPLWLLDEPTEGLDSQTEREIMELLFRLGADRTLLLISHRLLGLEQMDRIALMEEGQIRLCAPHQALLADDYYRSLHQRLAPA
ncbi:MULTISPECIES: heme ABC transporter ATP-binding protein/permease CydC [Aeromonas]|uniref:heme ABC transporter ATP-binding protein/permease CydC n=1 Tax=Aeromonas TaxID=642 RepID=UPI0007EDFCF3|nr:cysteine/glutathione ABC transporter ATP-binding protein/permease CydC [Aeromonas dhakensis]MDH0346807.1 cysteine/glutathione ABC transporter ATP-binding protein/permease CydC [Aeromonas dhakensis]OBR45850.1 cysteine/glutathione ABC transporter ATP-binding protein/permease CydC [Aeromonas dhakensis]UCM43994.1 cysteine/glutathione ABC transporter ATP-binding protein/permease CydC [Aeromonas dhakensis]